MPSRTWTLPASILSAAALSLLLIGCGSEGGITLPDGSSTVTLSFN